MRQLKKLFNIISPPDLIIMLVWISNPLLDYAQIVFNHLPIINSFSDAIIPFIFTLVVFGSLNFYRRVIQVNDILFYIVCALICGFSYVCYPQNATYMEVYFPDFLYSVLLVYFVGVSMVRIKKIFPHLELLSYITVICFFIFKNFVTTDGETVSAGGDMSGAYAILPHLMFISWRAIIRKGWSRILVPLVSVGILLILGNRGSLLCYIIFIIVYFLILEKKYKQPIFCIISAVLLVVTMCFSETIMMMAYYFVDSIGYSTRIFDKMLEDELLDSSGRNEIADMLINSIAERPFLGYGIAGDRLICDTYAHNLFLEFLVSYGVVFGGVIILMLIYIILRAYFKTHDIELKVFFLILFFSGFFPLMLSSTYLQEPDLFLFIGFSVLLAFRSKSIDHHKDLIR